jgi:hypothetical protein
MGDVDAEAIISKHYWNGSSYQMDEASITATLANINTYLTTLKTKVVDQNIVSDVNEVTNNNLLARQWTHGDLLNNSDLDLYKNADGFTYPTDSTALCTVDCVDATLYSSVAQIQMGFITEPEMSQSGCDVSTTFTTAMVLNMFNQDHAAYANTFLNPEMYYNFQTSYEAADWDTISSTYSLDQEQSKCMIRWVAQQTAFNSEQSIGNMMTATIARSM